LQGNVQRGFRAGARTGTDARRRRTRFWWDGWPDVIDFTSMARSHLAVCVVALLGACTPWRWEHPQLGLASLDSDIQECDTLAWRESLRYGHGFGAADFPGYYRGRDGRLYSRAFSGPRHNPFFEEMRLREYCMRSKGYRMAPVPG
jgi:hypothetical protein